MWLWIPKVQASLKEILVSKLREFSINQPWLVMVGKSAFDQRLYPESIRIVWLTFSSGRVKLKYTRHKRVYEINYLCMCSRTLFTIALQVGLTNKFFTQLPPLVMLINLFYCCLWIYFLLFNTVTISQWWPCWYIQFKKNKGESCCVERIPTVINKAGGVEEDPGVPMTPPLSPFNLFFPSEQKLVSTLCFTQCDSSLRNPGFSSDIHAFLIMKKRPRLHSAGTHPNFISMRQQGKLWTLT